MTDETPRTEAEQPPGGWGHSEMREQISGKEVDRQMAAAAPPEPPRPDALERLLDVLERHPEAYRLDTGPMGGEYVAALIHARAVTSGIAAPSEPRLTHCPNCGTDLAVELVEMAVAASIEPVAAPSEPPLYGGGWDGDDPNGVARSATPSEPPAYRATPLSLPIDGSGPAAPSEPPRPDHAGSWRWWGVDHYCKGQRRKYPDLEWADKSRRGFRCNVCGDAYAFYASSGESGSPGDDR